VTVKTWKVWFYWPHELDIEFEEYAVYYWLADRWEIRASMTRLRKTCSALVDEMGILRSREWYGWHCKQFRLVRVREGA
jgi:hypothetical protein